MRICAAILAVAGWPGRGLGLEKGYFPSQARMGSAMLKGGGVGLTYQVRVEKTEAKG